MVVWVWSVGVVAVLLWTGVWSWLVVACGLVEAGVGELVEGWVEEGDGAGLAVVVVGVGERARWLAGARFTKCQRVAIIKFMLRRCGSQIETGLLCYADELDDQDGRLSGQADHGEGSALSSSAELQTARNAFAAICKAIFARRRDVSGESKPARDDEYVVITNQPGFLGAPIKVEIPRELYAGLYGEGPHRLKEVDALKRQLKYHERLSRMLFELRADQEREGVTMTDEELSALIDLRLQVLDRADHLRDRINEIERGPYRFKVGSGIVGQ